MSRRQGRHLARWVVGGAVAAVLAGSGVVMAQQAEAPPADPIGDILSRQPEPVAPPQEAPPPLATTPPTPATTETLNAPPPSVVIPPNPNIVVAETPLVEDEAETDEPEEVVAPEKKADEPPPPPGRRQRRQVAVVKAIDKITAETMTFAVRVGGPPVRFRNSLIFTARACELSASDEQEADSAAYLEIRSQPRTSRGRGEARQVFRGWMFAGAPSVNPLEHPIYDAWVVGCRSA